MSTGHTWPSHHRGAPGAKRAPAQYACTLHPQPESVMPPGPASGAVANGVSSPALSSSLLGVGAGHGGDQGHLWHPHRSLPLWASASPEATWAGSSLEELRTRACAHSPGQGEQQRPWPEWGRGARGAARLTLRHRVWCLQRTGVGRLAGAPVLSHLDGTSQPPGPPPDLRTHPLAPAHVCSPYCPDPHKPGLPLASSRRGGATCGHSFCSHRTHQWSPSMAGAASCPSPPQDGVPGLRSPEQAHRASDQQDSQIQSSAESSVLGANVDPSESFSGPVPRRAGSAESSVEFTELVTRRNAGPSGGAGTLGGWRTEQVHQGPSHLPSSLQFPPPLARGSPNCKSRMPSQEAAEPRERGRGHSPPQGLIQSQRGAEGSRWPGGTDAEWWQVGGMPRTSLASSAGKWRSWDHGDR